MNTSWRLQSGTIWFGEVWEGVCSCMRTVGSPCLGCMDPSVLRWLQQRKESDWQTILAELILILCSIATAYDFPGWVSSRVLVLCLSLVDARNASDQDLLVCTSRALHSSPL